MADITIAFDPGSILSKVFYTLKTFQPELLTMESEVAEVSPKSLEDYEEKLGNPAPENSAWIEYQGEYRAVGFLARNQFYADLKLEEPKFRLALFKTLAIVGVLAIKKSLPNGATIQLGILLPYGEYSDRKIFEQLITEALAGFRFRGEHRSFELLNCVCRPEGFGLISRGRSPGLSLKEQTIAVTMTGYRDASVYVMDRGIMTKGATRELGFHKFVEAVRAQAPGQKDLILTKAICHAGSKVSVRALAHLSRFSEPALRDVEVSRIRKAITHAKEQYWLTLSTWLRSYIPNTVDEVIIAGGTAHYYERELNSLFPGTTKVNWGTELEEQIHQFFLKKVSEQGLTFRLTDVYGFFYYLTAESFQERVMTI